MKSLFTAMIFSLSLVDIGNAQALTSECDFSSYKPLAVSHALLKAAVRKVQPPYPSAALSVRAEGKVAVKILVDRKGNVIEACVSDGHPFLKVAAREAALGWKFKENFGFTRKTKLSKKWRFVQSEISFNFKSN